MTTMTESFIVHLLILTLLAEFRDVRAYPRSSDPRMPFTSGRSQMSETFLMKQQTSNVKDSPGRPITRVKTVTVTCHENYMEIAIKADLFDLGLPVDASELRLGADSQFIPACKVTASSSNQFIIAAELTDCGTQHWITDESLIYTNLLIFSPQPSPDGVIRLENAVVPIECHYSRRFDVTNKPIRPTWIPFSSTQSTVEDLQFSLKLMTSDWSSARASGVYFLGDTINMEASFRLDHHGNLRIFIESCVATVTPDINSVPRYTFIENHGCLMDGQLTGSKSRFLARIQNDRLQLQLDAFRFHQEKRPEIYITCILQAYPVMDEVNPVHKACSFIDGSWRSSDGDDWTCYSCQKRKDYAPSFRLEQEQSLPPHGSLTDQTSYTHRPSKFQPRIQDSSGSSLNVLQTSSEPFPPSWRSIIVPQEEESGSVGWEQEKTVGPLTIFPKKTEMGFLAPPRVKEGVPPSPSLSKGKRPIPHSSLWKSGATAGMDMEGDVTHPSSLEPTEQSNITASEPEPKQLEDEDDDEYEEEDEDDNSDEYAEEDEKAGEATKDMWDVEVLPENDLEKLFTTKSSSIDEDYVVTALDTSPSLLDEVEPTATDHPLKDTLVTNLWKAMDADKDEMDPTGVEESLVLKTRAELNT
ncbi:zona pellucida sperm-binding protein 3-like [Myxocyprinus asiaticus]|uniref:zona pellucida sperm-binding protein 3-like n=1 Tax=Myxocyprinus asiaticus TaxID=70543 RepID=UPI002222C112|nr:zona pellucida sperm-binding protein 3-like [Myxocyprinus asiaticus]